MRARSRYVLDVSELGRGSDHVIPAGPSKEFPVPQQRDRLELLRRLAIARRGLGVRIGDTSARR
jgi:hypothetical protein